MIEYGYLVLAMLSSASLSIMSSLFGRRSGSVRGVSSLYSVVVTASAAAVWGIASLWKGVFDARVIGYSLLYGLFYAMAMIGMFLAYRHGSISLTAFVKQLSLITVALWGFIFWGNKLSVTLAVGLLLIALALYLCFRRSRTAMNDGGVSWQWGLYAAMLLCGNAGCSITQKYQQLAFGEASSNGFMLLATLISFACCFVLYVKEGRIKPREVGTSALVFPILGGISSALLNMLILLLMASPLSESVIFPGIAVGGLILTVLFSTLVYRERLSVSKWIGLLVGSVALVFLNI